MDIEGREEFADHACRKRTGFPFRRVLETIFDSHLIPFVRSFADLGPYAACSFYSLSPSPSPSILRFLFSLFLAACVLHTMSPTTSISNVRSLNLDLN